MDWKGDDDRWVSRTNKGKSMDRDHWLGDDQFWEQYFQKHTVGDRKEQQSVSNLIWHNKLFQTLLFFLRPAVKTGTVSNDFHLFCWSSCSVVGETSWSFDRLGWGRRHLHWLWMQCCQLVRGVQWWASLLPLQQEASTTATTESVMRRWLLEPTMLNCLHRGKPLYNVTSWLHTSGV